MSDAERIHDFFAGTGKDHAGRSIQDYLDMSNDDLEKIHDYIQWAFPTRQLSRCQAANAPLLSDEAVALVKDDQKAIRNYYAMWTRMTNFYIKTEHWLVDFDHNHLRITRIIESTAEFFDIMTADMFANVILHRNRNANSPINRKSIDFWLRALDAAMARDDNPDADIELVGGFYVPKTTT